MVGPHPQLGHVKKKLNFFFAAHCVTAVSSANLLRCNLPGENPEEDLNVALQRAEEKLVQSLGVQVNFGGCTGSFDFLDTKWRAKDGSSQELRDSLVTQFGARGGCGRRGETRDLDPAKLQDNIVSSDVEIGAENCVAKALVQNSKESRKSRVSPEEICKASESLKKWVKETVPVGGLENANRGTVPTPKEMVKRVQSKLALRKEFAGMVPGGKRAKFEKVMDKLAEEFAFSLTLENKNKNLESFRDFVKNKPFSMETCVPKVVAKDSTWWNQLKGWQLDAVVLGEPVCKKYKEMRDKENADRGGWVWEEEEGPRVAPRPEGDDEKERKLPGYMIKFHEYVLMLKKFKHPEAFEFMASLEFLDNTRLISTKGNALEKHIVDMPATRDNCVAQIIIANYAKGKTTKKDITTSLSQNAVGAVCKEIVEKNITVDEARVHFIEGTTSPRWTLFKQAFKGTVISMAMMGGISAVMSPVVSFGKKMWDKWRGPEVTHLDYRNLVRYLSFLLNEQETLQH